ncbi:MAG: hypothetical protein ACSLE0_15205 [Chitinophagaceae bacterium]
MDTNLQKRKLGNSGLVVSIKDEKAKEAETNVKKWLQKLKIIEEAP